MSDDGETYIGKESDIHERMHAAFRDKGALHDLGYTTDQTRELDWIEMPGATDGELYEREGEWIRNSGGIGKLANRINSPGGP